MDGKYAQSFPDFGPERLGAPIAAFARIDSQPIEIRSQVYTPNAVVVFEGSLLSIVPVTQGMVPNGKLVVNWTNENVDELKKIGEKAGVSTLCLNANRIATELIGSPTVSTIMLGALAQASGFVSMGALEKIVMERFHGSMGETNVEMVRMGFKEVKEI